MQKTLLIISYSDLHRDPRVNRQIRFFHRNYRTIAMGLADPCIPGVDFIYLMRRNLGEKILLMSQLLLRQYEQIVGHKHIKPLLEKLRPFHVDLILANDVNTLLLALLLAEHMEAKVIFDAHEYAPLEFEDKLVWRILWKRYNTYLCTTYIPKVAAMITVCQGIAEQYEKDTGVRPVVVTNAPDYVEIEPQIRSESEQKIRLIHHGVAIRSRKIEKMIEMMDYLDTRFELDVMLVEADKGCLQELKRFARRNKKIRFLPAVPMQELVTFSNNYDVGLFLLEPTNFNYLHALPNKFFEFIQSRLAVAIGPSPEMARIVQSHDCGVVSSDFSPKTLAHCLMQLDHRKINYYKQQSHNIARLMSAEQNRVVLLDVVERVLKGEQA
jgi:hypothetical protein